MKTVEIKISTADKQDGSSNVVMVESKRGDIWNRDRAEDLVTNKGSMTFQLRPNQRIVIDSGIVNEQPVYDRAQGAAVLPSQQKQEVDARTGEIADRPLKEGAPDQKQQADVTAKTLKQEETRLAKSAELMGMKPQQSAGGSPTKPSSTTTTAKPHPNPEPLDSAQSMKPAGTEDPNAEPNTGAAGAPVAERAGSAQSNQPKDKK